MKKYEVSSFEITAEVLAWLENTLNVLKKYENDIDNNSINSKTRMCFLSDMGHTFDEYKHKIYNIGFTDKEKTEYGKVFEFLRLCEKYIDKTIKENRRKDGLYHSYNVMTVKGDEIEIKHLKLMLEGQVDVLGCNYLSDKEACNVLEAMEKSSLYSDKENTYYLYPIIHTKAFLEKNIIQNAEKSELIKLLITDTLPYIRANLQMRQDISYNMKRANNIMQKKGFANLVR